MKKTAVLFIGTLLSTLMLTGCFGSHKPPVSAEPQVNEPVAEEVTETNDDGDNKENAAQDNKEEALDVNESAEENKEPEEDVQVSEQPEEVTDVSNEDNTEAPLTIELAWEVPEGPDGAFGGNLHSVMYVDKDYTEESVSAATSYAYDSDGNMLFECSSNGDTYGFEPEENGVPHYTLCYRFFSSDLNMNLIIEPDIPENVPELHTVRGRVTFNGKEYIVDEQSMCRGQTGIWYINVGELANGEWTSGQ